MIIGVDLGNYNTKPSKGKPFPSKVNKRIDIINQRGQNDKNLIEYKGKKLLIGEGDLQTEANKMDKELYIYCLLTALARSSEDERFFKVALPIPGNQYTTENVNRLKKEVLADKMHEFVLAGKKRTIIIEDVLACSEVEIAYNGMTYEQRNEVRGKDLILVNIGGGNVNIGYFKQTENGRRLEQSSTLPTGTIAMFSEIVNAVNGMHSLTLRTEDAAGILQHGLIIDDRTQDMSFIKDILLDHTDRIYQQLNMYPIKTAKLMFTGGGSKTLRTVLKKKTPTCLFQTNYLEAGAIGLERAGVKVWQGQ